MANGCGGIEALKNGIPINHRTTLLNVRARRFNAIRTGDHNCGVVVVYLDEQVIRHIAVTASRLNSSSPARAISRGLVRRRTCAYGAR